MKEGEPKKMFFGKTPLRVVSRNSPLSFKPHFDCPLDDQQHCLMTALWRANTTTERSIAFRAMNYYLSKIKKRQKRSPKFYTLVGGPKPGVYSQLTTIKKVVGDYPKYRWKVYRSFQKAFYAVKAICGEDFFVESFPKIGECSNTKKSLEELVNDGLPVTDASSRENCAKSIHEFRDFESFKVRMTLSSKFRNEFLMALPYDCQKLIKDKVKDGLLEHLMTLQYQLQEVDKMECHLTNMMVRQFCSEDQPLTAFIHQIDPSNKKFVEELFYAGMMRTICISYKNIPNFFGKKIRNIIFRTEGAWYFTVYSTMPYYEEKGSSLQFHPATHKLIAGDYTPHFWQFKNPIITEHLQNSKTYEKNEPWRDWEPDPQIYDLLGTTTNIKLWRPISRRRKNYG